jgi:hypothetical protein
MTVQTPSQRIEAWSAIRDQASADAKALPRGTREHKHAKQRAKQARAELRQVRAELRATGRGFVPIIAPDTIGPAALGVGSSWGPVHDREMIAAHLRARAAELLLVQSGRESAAWPPADPGVTITTAVAYLMSRYKSDLPSAAVVAHADYAGAQLAARDVTGPGVTTEQAGEHLRRFGAELHHGRRHPGFAPDELYARRVYEANPEPDPDELPVADWWDRTARDAAKWRDAR